MLYKKYIKDGRVFNFTLEKEGILCSIPMSQKNRHYVEYLKWVEATPEERESAGVIFAPDEVLD